MLYLAEVQKQKTGFMGSAKAELKLLAFQRADLSWNPLPREELIPSTTEETNNLSDGVLVLVDLNPQRQVQRLQEAGRPLVSILQNFSRQLEKFKSQEEEITQWKQSLTYQSQELNSRQMEMEARLEQMQQMEEDFERLEAQRQQINTAQEETQRLREEIERKRQELEGAWEHLLGEQRRLEERQTTGWDQDRTRQLQELIAGAESGVTPTKALLLELELAFEMVATQQDLLNQHWQQLDRQRGSTQQQQEEVDSLAQGLQNRLRESQQSQTSLEQTKSELQIQTSVLMIKQEQVQRLSVQLRQYEELYQQIYGMVERSSSDEASQKVDVSALEEMPLDQLQQLVQSYTNIMEKASWFVSEQEEELSFLYETIAELQAKLQQAVERDRQHLEMELAEEQDHYQMLNETLVGQRQNLQEREEILNQHRRVLLRREGNTVAQGQEEQKRDLEPLLAQVVRYKQQQSGELQELEHQIEQLRFDIQQALEMVDRQSQEQETQWQELQSLEQNLLSLRTATAESWGRVNLYQEMLQPVQDSLDGLRYRLETLASSLARVEETSNEQLQTIAQMRQTLKEGVGSRE